MSRSATRRQGRWLVGFTLVELLVVIGIIALLLSTLIPTLGGIRRNAQAIKCAAALREIGTSLSLYSRDYDGYYPVAQLRVDSSATYELNGVIYPDVDNGHAYWFDFLHRYVSKARSGAADAGIVQQTIVWGCPTWEQYVDIPSRVQTGLGMTLWPTFQPDYPAATSGGGGPFGPPPSAPEFPTNQKELNFINGWAPGKVPGQSITTTTHTGAFQRQNVFGKRGAQRAVMADSRFWAVESQRIPTNGVIPPQSTINNTVTYSAAGQTMIDIYRHGKYPPPGTAIVNTLGPRGGKVGFNVLYGDGHVALSNEARDAYLRTRMKFPG